MNTTSEPNSQAKIVGTLVDELNHIDTEATPTGQLTEYESRGARDLSPFESLLQFSAPINATVATAIDDLLVGERDIITDDLRARLLATARVAISKRELSSGFFEVIATSQREALQLSVADLADKLGRDSVEIAQIERGQKRVTSLPSNITAQWIRILKLAVDETLETSLLRSLTRPPMAYRGDRNGGAESAREYVDEVMRLARSGEAEAN
jgi:transcriptional regulator with XRE-family HTH domain